MEHFLWLNVNDSTQLAQCSEDVSDEFADIVKYVLLFADVAGINIFDAVLHKMGKDALEYPVHKAKGSCKKYTQL